MNQTVDDSDSDNDEFRQRFEISQQIWIKQWCQWKSDFNCFRLKSSYFEIKYKNTKFSNVMGLLSIKRSKYVDLIKNW